MLGERGVQTTVHVKEEVRENMTHLEHHKYFIPIGLQYLEIGSSVKPRSRL